MSDKQKIIYKDTEKRKFFRIFVFNRGCVFCLYETHQGKTTKHGLGFSFATLFNIKQE